MLNHSLATAITGYQKYISPYKGFCCAHRVRHGSLSCSEYAKQTLLHNSVWQALPLIRQRFKDCKAAALALADTNTRNRYDRNQRSGRRPNRNNVLDYCDCCNAAELIPSHSCSTVEIAGGGADACACTP